MRFAPTLSLLTRFLAAIGLLASFHVQAACPPNAAALKAGKWQVDDAAKRQALAIDMLDCLHSPDPVLRDEIGFEGLQHWMRSEKLETSTVQAIRLALTARLTAADPTGFGQPFAALVLAEVARVDRLKPYLTPAERSALVAASTAYLSGVRDYRGFDQQAGWRHGVAHAADLMLQLSLNGQLGKAEHEAMLAAIASQVMAHGGHFYVYGEGERLMAPVFYVARRDTLAAADWDAWFTRLLAPFNPKAATTQLTLAQRHNLKAFLLPLYASLNEGGNPAQKAALQPFVTRALKALN
jgi:hypothetical protein